MSNALEQASLIMVPSGYEDGTLGSLKPTDGSGDFTFSRGSNTSATRVNEQGYIEKGYENLLLQSNQFDTTWTKANGATITGGQSGYDGSSDAWLLNAPTAGSARTVFQSVSVSGIHTASIRVKKGTTDFVAFRAYNIIELWADLSSTGVITQVNGEIDSKIISLGNGWFELNLTGDFSSVSSFAIYTVNASGSYDADAGDNIYIQDAMLNQGLVAYPYIETTTAPVAGGILEDMPRLDYSNGSCPALLLEPQRTNLVEDSEYFADRKYSSTIITQNYGISPEGVVNSALIDKNGVAYGRVDFLNMNLAAGSYTFSLFVKGSDVVKVRTDGNAGQYAAYINCATGAVSAAISETSFDNYYSVDYGNGWYRFIGIVTTTSDFLYHSRIYVMDVAGGEGNTNPATAEIYGYQVEQDATYETSYIPTYGVSQTRLQELGRVGDYIGSTITFGPTDDFAILYDGEIFEREVMILGGGNSQLNAGRLWIRNNEIRIDGTTPSASLMANTQEVIPLNTRFKLLAKRNGSVVDFFKDGQKLSTNQFDTDAEFVINSLFWSFNNAYICYGNHNQLTIFPTALTDSECIELTTIS